jgi:hypothetical protein
MLTPHPSKSLPVSERNVVDLAHEYAKCILRAKEDTEYPLTAQEEKTAIDYLKAVW